MGILDMLGYVGDSLAKPGRAVRGAMVGRPDELLAGVPFSDSLGLTDPSQATSGHQLLQHFGMDPGDGLGGMAADFGAEMATDPLTYAGGALAKGLLGGLGRGRKGFSEADDVFDLVSPTERAMDAERGAMIDNAFPVPAATEPEAKAVSPILDALGGAGDDVGDAAAQLPPLTEVPRPDNYSLGIGYGPDHDLLGAPADALMEHGAPAAFDIAYGGWEGVIKDLQRMTPEAKGGLFGSDAYDAEWLAARGIAPGIPTSESGTLMANTISNRLGDLSALAELGPQVSSPELIARARDQMARLAPLSPWTAQSTALAAAKDIQSGRIRPSEVKGHLEYLSHLPVNEAELRRLAAGAQADNAWAHLNGNINAVREYGDGQLMDIAALPEMYNEEALVAQLRNLLDPQTLVREAGIEPNIARRVLENPVLRPGGDEWMADQVGELRRLLEQLQAQGYGQTTGGPIGAVDHLR